MPTVPNYRKLIERLSDLYPTIDDSKRILKYANIRLGAISYSNTSDNNWSNIISYAEARKGKFEALIQAAVDDSDDSELLDYIKEETAIVPMKDASLYYKSELDQDVTELQKALKSLVEKGELEDVLGKLRSIAEQMDSTKYENAIVGLHARLNNLLRDQSQGIITYDQYTVGKNRIIQSINFQIDELESQREVQEILTGLLPSSTGVKVQDKSIFEKVMGGTDDIVPIEWLYNAVERSKVVGKVELADGGSGTGFLVKGGYVLTNHHVVCKTGPIGQQTTLDRPQNARLLLDFQNTKEAATYELDTANGYYINEELDYALLKIKDKTDMPIAKWGYAEFDTFHPPKVKDLINIIQHPEGEKKKIAMPDRVISNWSDKNYLFYLADTKPGSSGSPVFNQDWKVVALHHAGVKAVDGGMVINAAGDRKESNRGILITAILADLKAKGIDLE